MPDIDIDFSVQGRDRVIRYVADKYGQESVAQIITFGRMFPRAATRDAARVLGYDYGAGDRLAKLIPDPIMGRSPSFEDCLKPGEELARAYEKDPQAKEIVDLASGLESTVRNTSIHAAAVVIADRPLTDIVPLQLAEDRGVVDEDGERSYRIGHAVLDEADREDRPAEDGLPRAAQPRRDRERPRHHRALRPASGRTWPRCRSTTRRPTRCSRRGDSIGVFQFESEGMREALRKVSPTEFEDLIALVALYRPGAMRYIDTYARGKRNPERGHLHRRAPALRSPSPPTASILYQEQTCRSPRTSPASPAREADDLRKAIGKKDRAGMASMKEQVHRGRPRPPAPPSR